MGIGNKDLRLSANLLTFILSFILKYSMKNVKYISFFLLIAQFLVWSVI